MKRLLIIAIVLGGLWFLFHSSENPEIEKDTEDPTTVEESANTEEGEDTSDSEDTLPEASEEENAAVTSSEKETAETQPSSPVTPVVATPAPTPAPKQPTVNPVPNTLSLVRVYLYEWEIDFSDKEIPEGTVLFEVYNSGSFSHNFAIKGVRDFGKIKPGELRTFTVNLSRGDYFVYSSKDIDFDNGMSDILFVQ